MLPCEVPPPSVVTASSEATNIGSAPAILLSGPPSRPSMPSLVLSVSDCARSRCSVPSLMPTVSCCSVCSSCAVVSVSASLRPGSPLVCARATVASCCARATSRTSGVRTFSSSGPTGRAQRQSPDLPIASSDLIGAACWPPTVAVASGASSRPPPPSHASTGTSSHPNSASFCAMVGVDWPGAACWLPDISVVAAPRAAFAIQPLQQRTKRSAAHHVAPNGPHAHPIASSTSAAPFVHTVATTGIIAVAPGATLRPTSPSSLAHRSPVACTPPLGRPCASRPHAPLRLTSTRSTCAPSLATRPSLGRPSHAATRGHSSLAARLRSLRAFARVAPVRMPGSSWGWSSSK